MSRIPALTSRQLLEALQRGGYEQARQSGSHLTMKHPDRSMVIVPLHARDVNRATMMRIIRQAGYTEDEFLALL